MIVFVCYVMKEVMMGWCMIEEHDVSRPGFNFTAFYLPLPLTTFRNKHASLALWFIVAELMQHNNSSTGGSDL